MELASNRKGLVFLSALLSSLSAVASFVPYLAVYFIIRSIIGVYPTLGQLDMGVVMRYAWMALGGILANIVLYFLAIFSSHIAAFGILYELKVYFANHITRIPLGYHLEGAVRIGGVDVRDMTLDDLMHHVSFVFQDIFLFKQSILDNSGKISVDKYVLEV